MAAGAPTVECPRVFLDRTGGSYSRWCSATSPKYPQHDVGLVEERVYRSLRTFGRAAWSISLPPNDLEGGLEIVAEGSIELGCYLVDGAVPFGDVSWRRDKEQNIHTANIPPLRESVVSCRSARRSCPLSWCKSRRRHCAPGWVWPSRQSAMMGR